MTFWTPKKSPKKRQGVCADRLSADMTLVPIPSGLRPYPLDKGSRPLDPYLRGPPMRRFSVDAKARAAQLIGFPSITATAESLVTFRWTFSRLEARLLADSGSSAAQRDGGRVRMPIPTEKTRLP